MYDSLNSYKSFISQISTQAYVNILKKNALITNLLKVVAALDLAFDKLVVLLMKKIASTRL